MNLSSSLTETADYLIVVQGGIDQHLAALIGDLTILPSTTVETDAFTTMLAANLDQAALTGLLNHVYDLGLALVSLKQRLPGSAADFREL